MTGMQLCGPGAVELPDAGQGMCCMGAAVNGPQHCTCWEEVYDQPQTPPDVRSLPNVGASMCGDCAFRPSSPERQGEAGYASDADDLDDLVHTGTAFYCHAGMRRVVALHHPPSGTMVEAHPGDYAPGVADTGIPYRADGRAAIICAGWAARRRAFVRELERWRDTPEEVGNGQ